MLQAGGPDDTPLVQTKTNQTTEFYESLGCVIHDAHLAAGERSRNLGPYFPEDKHLMIRTPLTLKRGPSEGLKFIEDLPSGEVPLVPIPVVLPPFLPLSDRRDADTAQFPSIVLQ